MTDAVASAGCALRTATALAGAVVAATSSSAVKAVVQRKRFASKMTRSRSSAVYRTARGRFAAATVAEEVAASARKALTALKEPSVSVPLRAAATIAVATVRLVLPTAVVCPYAKARNVAAMVADMTVEPARETPRARPISASVLSIRAVLPVAVNRNSVLTMAAASLTVPTRSVAAMAAAAAAAAVVTIRFALAEVNALVSLHPAGRAAAATLRSATKGPVARPIVTWPNVEAMVVAARVVSAMLAVSVVAERASGPAANVFPIVPARSVAGMDVVAAVVNVAATSSATLRPGNAIPASANCPPNSPLTPSK
jgi:hypothetical protein